MIREFPRHFNVIVIFCSTWDSVHPEIDMDTYEIMKCKTLNLKTYIVTRCDKIHAEKVWRK